MDHRIEGKEGFQVFGYEGIFRTDGSKQIGKVKKKLRRIVFAEWKYIGIIDKIGYDKAVPVFNIFAKSPYSQMSYRKQRDKEIHPMFYILPMLSIIAIYLLAAVLPAIFLLRYIYRMDRVEKEPPALLRSLLIRGVAAALVSILLEYVGRSILSSFLDVSSPAYTILLAFLVVAVVEEGTKFAFLKRRTWRDPNFNFRFDGIVYAVFVSLGFAAFENINYVLGYGLTVALPRAVLAIPAHMGFAVFMGLFYGRAKLREHEGNNRGKVANLWAGYLAAVALHGLYDTCVMIGNVLATVAFVAFIVVMYIIVIRLIKKESMSDRPV